VILIKAKEDTDKQPGSGKNDQASEKHNRGPGDQLSRKILKKWQSGVIICTWSNFFWNNDDIEMK
jgi:hypothetical protein